MIRHIFTLMWHRKRENALIIVEMLFTFLILFSMLAVTLHFYRLYTLPLGFNVANNWTVTIATGSRQMVEGDEEKLNQLLSVLNQMDEIAAAGTMLTPPFSQNNRSSNIEFPDKQIFAQVNLASDGLTEALGMRLVEGRWYGSQDDGQNENAVVINQRLREEIGGEAVLGSLIPEAGRVVGIFEDFRQFGEFSVPRAYMIQRENANYQNVRTLVLVLRPGVTTRFEEQLMNTLQGAAPNWDFEVSRWTALQQQHFRTYTTPLFIAAVLVLFLVVMVGLGLLGVLWQNIIRRTPEMGLRRAMGAPASTVRLQVILELLAVASKALVLGFAIVVQFPLTGIVQALDWTLFVPAATMSAFTLLLLCILFALYPSYQATRRDPVEALRYE